jgi:hypothetical protein
MKSLSACSSNPPAISTTSYTLDSWASSYTPGDLTAPETYTNILLVSCGACPNSDHLELSGQNINAPIKLKAIANVNKNPPAKYAITLDILGV